MRLLLDTHTFIWFVTDSPRLSDRVKQLIEDDYNEKLLSPASIWEMAIKHSMGKLNFSTPFPQFIEQQIGLNSMDLLPIEISHINVVSTLALHHRDPFDRLLISQALVENMPILSVDKAFDAYPIERIW
jgi:PIN domain nuclease of toxin-antitoxin system